MDNVTVFKIGLLNIVMVVCSGSNTDYNSSEPLRTLCCVMLCYIRHEKLKKVQRKATIIWRMGSEGFEL